MTTRRSTVVWITIAAALSALLVAVAGPPADRAAAAPAPTTTGGTPTAPPPPPVPRVSALQAPTVVIARQGHARFLVGVRTRTDARVIARILTRPGGKVVKTAKSPDRHAPGRVWLLVDANDSRGFQLKAGKYELQVYAVDALKRRSNVLTRRFTLTLRPPRGVVQASTIPTWPSVIAGVAAAPGGQLVTAVATDSPLAKAGLQRGDVIRTVNGLAVDARGAWFVALRQLPSGTPVPIEFDRAGVRQAIQHTAPPDWSKGPDYAPLLTAAVQAAPGVLAYKYAQVRERLDAKDVAAAKALHAAWTAPERATAPGELLAGAILSGERSYVAAAGAFNRALVADPTMAAAQFGLGIARNDNAQNDRAIVAFQAARNLDPTDAVAATFHAFSLLIADQFDPALQAADAAIALDPRYEEARLARGLALIGLARVPEGVAELKRGLVLSDNAARAQQLITSSLEPNTP